MINFDMSKKISIVLGHYGSGKTNFCVNLAIYLAQKGEKVTVVDLDIVNPYFRTADFKQLFDDNNIRLITPNFANTNLDVPSLNSNIDAVISNPDGYVIIDVGGDDVGATVLGRYANIITRIGYECFYIANVYRYLTKSTTELIGIMQEIERVSRLKVSKIVNNSNLKNETTKETIINSIDLVKDFSKQTQLPIACTCICDKKSVLLDKELKSCVEDLFIIQDYIKVFE